MYDRMLKALDKGTMPAFIEQGIRQDAILLPVDRDKLLEELAAATERRRQRAEHRARVNSPEYIQEAYGVDRVEAERMAAARRQFGW